jgi:hypothetical protein
LSSRGGTFLYQKWHQKFYGWHKIFDLSTPSQVMETQNCFIAENFYQFERMEEVVERAVFVLHRPKSRTN